MKLATKIYVVITNKTQEFLKDCHGATAIEYGLIAALVSVAIIAALQLLGSELSTIFNRVGNELNNASS